MDFIVFGHKHFYRVLFSVTFVQDWMFQTAKSHNMEPLTLTFLCRELFIIAFLGGIIKLVSAAVYS